MWFGNNNTFSLCDNIDSRNGFPVNPLSDVWTKCSEFNNPLIIHLSAGTMNASRISHFTFGFKSDDASFESGIIGTTRPKYGGKDPSAYSATNRDLDSSHTSPESCNCSCCVNFFPCNWNNFAKYDSCNLSRNTSTCRRFRGTSSMSQLELKMSASGHLYSISNPDEDDSTGFCSCCCSRTARVDLLTPICSLSSVKRCKLLNSSNSVVKLDMVSVSGSKFPSSVFVWVAVTSCLYWHVHSEGSEKSEGSDWIGRFDKWPRTPRVSLSIFWMRLPRSTARVGASSLTGPRLCFPALLGLLEFGLVLRFLRFLE